MLISESKDPISVVAIVVLWGYCTKMVARYVGTIGKAIVSVRTINTMSATKTMNCHKHAIVGRMKTSSNRVLYFAGDLLRTLINV